MSRAPLTDIELDQVLGQLPAAVVVVEAGSGRIMYSNARAREMSEGQLRRAIPSELTHDWVIFHPDGRRYAVDEWPLVRSMTSGEHVLDEECFHVRPDGSHVVLSCSSSPLLGDDAEIVAGVLIMRDITQERHARERLAPHVRLVDVVEDAVVGTDAEFRLTVWNRGAERLYGYAAGEVLGRDARDVASYAGDTSPRALERELLETDRARTEITAHRKDGTPVEVELIAVAVRGERGEITGYLGIHRDMTDRKRAEHALHASHRQIETILESLTDAFVALDRRWRYTYVNDRALRRLEAWRGSRIARHDILGRSIWELFPDLVGTDLGHRLRETMRAQHPVEFELHFAPTDEWVEARAYPSAAGLSVYFRNVSERRRATEELERSARRQAAVAELGVRALAGDDLQAVMDDAAAVCARMLEVELVGIHEALGDGDELALRAGVGWSDGAVGGEAGVAGRGSLMGYALTAADPVLSDDIAADPRFAASPLLAEHRAAGAVCVVIDGRHEPFGALGAFAARPRSFSATDVDFVQAVANVLASAVERAETEARLIEVREGDRRRIARDLHDGALQDLSEALAEAATAGGGSRDAEERLEHLVPALRRIGRHVRGAIYDLRLGAEEDRPFRELLEGLVAAQRPLAGGCEIDLSIAEGVPVQPLGRRGTGVLRIIGEAIINARRHAAADHIRIAVSGSARRLHVEVSDDGRGFDVHERPQSTGATGLDSMRDRAGLLDGDLHIAGRRGVGTRIRLDVPLTDARRAPDGTARILLVEDHAAVREAIAAMFEREPDFHVVGQAPSLAAARELLDDVDVAVIDLALPDGDGADLIDELRAASPGAEALVLSANLDRAHTARAIEHGAAATLDKTAHLDEIVDVVRRLRAGEALLPIDEVADLLRFAGRRREEERADRAAIERLTAREREVLQGLADGLDTEAIARRLRIASRTARNHVASILTKLGVHSQLRAVLLALRYGVIHVR